MVPRKFNIVEFGGFDLASQFGEALPGIYDRIVDAIWNCVYIMCFGLKFAGVDIAPQYMTPEMFSDHIMLNGIISIDQNDVITIPSIEPPAPPPAILPVTFEENGTFNPPSGVDGYAPVTVDVRSGHPELSGVDVQLISMPARSNDLTVPHVANTDYTIYSVFKLISIPTDFYKVIGGATSESTGNSNGCYYAPYSQLMRLQGFGNGISKAIDNTLNHKYAIAVSVSITDKIIKYYVNDSLIGAQQNAIIYSIPSVLHGGRWFPTNSNYDKCTCDYVAVARRIQTDEQVISNLQLLSAYYNTDEATIVDL